MNFIDMTSHFYNTQLLNNDNVCEEVKKSPQVPNSAAVSQCSIEAPVVVITENDSKATLCGKCHKKERKKGHKEICQPINCDGSCEWKDCSLLHQFKLRLKRL